MLEIQEITKEDLSRLTQDTLVSFFDGNIERNHFEAKCFLPFLEKKTHLGENPFREYDGVQIEVDFLNLAVWIRGTAGRGIKITQKEDLIDFVHFFCKVTNTHFLLSYNDILLNYREDVTDDAD